MDNRKMYRKQKQYQIQEIIRFALQQSHNHYDVHKCSFFNRIIPIRNSLPDYVVASPTTNTFKAHLDKFGRTKTFHTIGKPTYCSPQVIVKLC